MAAAIQPRPLRLAIVAGALLTLPSTVLATSTSSNETAHIYGGEIAKPCEFPTTLSASGCTATLIHPQVVISAGHCGKLRSIRFGESIRKSAKQVPVKWCETTPWSSTDAQICVLKKAMKGLPTAPVLQGCEVEALKAKATVMVAGFGLDENDPKGGGGVDEKRWVETTINSVSKDSISVGGGGKGGCQGDSGGPVYLKLSDGTWRTIGSTHGGGSHPNCDAGNYKRTDQLIGWYEEQLRKHDEKGIDITPCFNDAGDWEPTQACGGYTKDVQGPFGAWSNNCGEGMPVQRYSATCGEPFAPNEDENEDDKGADEDDEKDKDRGDNDKDRGGKDSGKDPDEEEDQGPDEGNQGDNDDDDDRDDEDRDDDDAQDGDDAQDEEIEPQSDEDRKKSGGCIVGPGAAPAWPLLLWAGAVIGLGRRRRRSPSLPRA